MDLDNERDHADLRKKLDEIHVEVSEVRRFLLGNGKIGMVSQVLILWRGAIWFITAAGVAGIGWAISRFL